MSTEQPLNKMMIILSKSGLDSVYAAYVLANGARMEGIDCEIFFTFFGLDALHSKKMKKLHIATVGNPSMGMPTLVGGLPGMETLASNMMKKELEKMDIPEADEFLEILSASGVKLWACQLAMDMFHYKKEDMYEDMDEIITVGDFYEKANEANTQVIFI
ncbi:MAG: DsrE/DsrF/DrsH-like family protein [Flavobacteriaceae bacterium]|nr:DsrE/DsrF/DrsH-like family protein [Flavobacteriaceae bacterium]